MKRQRESRSDSSSPTATECCCYVLASQTDLTQTYTGQTNNFHRRLRQHNGELAGDCRSTKRNRPWRVLVLITGFRNGAEVAQFEWAMKNRRAPRSSGVANRIKTLLHLLQQPRATKKAPLFTEMEPLTIDVHLSRVEFLAYANIEELPSFPNGAYFTFHESTAN